MSDPSATDIRIALWHNGYNPLPLHGKVPAGKAWTTSYNDLNEEQIRSWDRFWPEHTNTGILAKRTPGLDLDLFNPQAAEACEAHVRERFEERGYVMTRIGRAPKRLIPFRTDAAFKKLTLQFAPTNGGSGDKIELLGDGQQFAAFGIHPETHEPYSWHGGSPLTVNHDDVPYASLDDAQKLLGELRDICADLGYPQAGRKASKSASFGNTYVSFDDLTEAIHSGTSLHDPVLKIAGKMSRARIARQACADILRGIYSSAQQPRYAERWGECEKAINYCYDKDEEKRRACPDAIFVADFLFHSKDNKFIYQPSGELWASKAVDGRLPWIGRTKPTTVIMQTAAVEQSTWMPGEPKLIKHKLIIKSGWRSRDNATVFNQYEPPDLELGDPEQAKPWRDHIKKTYPDEAAHIEQWLAHRVQFPEKKIQHALVLGGTQGIGKDTMLFPVVHAVGPWNVESVTPMQAMGRFNGFLQSVILIVSEARDLGDTNRPQFYEHFKNIICSSAAPVHRVDEKNRQEFYVPNLCGVIITTNHKAAGIFLPPEDRRHFVSWSPLELSDFEDGYFKTIWGFYFNGGVHHVAAYLHTLNLAGFDAEAPPPKTQAFWEMVNSGRFAEAVDLANALDQLGNPHTVTFDDLADPSGPVNAEFIVTIRQNKRMFPRWMEQCGYRHVNNPDNPRDGLWRIKRLGEAESKPRSVYGKSDIPFNELCKKIRARGGAC
jgi:hypothetical protein